MNHGLVSISEIEKQTLCENVYNEYIIHTYEFLKSCENVARVLRVKIPAGCYTNFRDALFHFLKLSRTTEWNELTCQAFAIREHANRAKTDASVTLLRRSAKVSGNILNRDDLPKEYTHKLVEKHDALRNKELHIRLRGMMLQSTNSVKLNDESILESFMDFLSYCKDYAVEQYKEVIREWPVDDEDLL